MVKDGSLEEDERMKVYYVDMRVHSASGIMAEAVLGEEAKDPFQGLVDSVDAYCEVSIGGRSLCTKIAMKQREPVWEERLEFVCSSKPKQASVVVINDDVKAASDVMGSGEFFFGEMFESESSFEGRISLSDEQRQRGTLKISVSCAVLDPLGVKRQLSCVRKELGVALQEKDQREQQLHHTELTFQHKLDELQSDHRQEIFIYDQRIQQLTRELTASHKRLARIDFKYQATHNELKQQLLQLRIKEADNQQTLTNMEKEILAAADKVLQTEHHHKSLQSQLQESQSQVQSSHLKLNHTRSIVLQQAKELEQKATTFQQELTAKEQQIIDTGIQLAKMTQQVEHAKMEQLQKQNELDALREQMLQQHEQQQQQQKQKQNERDSMDEKKEAMTPTPTSTSRGFFGEENDPAATTRQTSETELGNNYGEDIFACGVINACDDDCKIM